MIAIIPDLDAVVNTVVRDFIQRFTTLNLLSYSCQAVAPLMDSSTGMSYLQNPLNFRYTL